jgi:hypothetical protein
MSPMRSRPGTRIAAGAGVVLCIVFAWQAAACSGAEPTSVGPSASASEVAGGGPTPDTTASPLDTAAASPTDIAALAPSATVAATRSATRSPSPAPKFIAHPWTADPSLVAAKNEGRVTIDSSGKVVVLTSAPPAPQYPATAALDVSWSRNIQEPPTQGKDARGTAYTDLNYKLLCGPGAAAAVLYYWPATQKLVTTKAGYFVEPVNVGKNHYAKTYWTGQAATGNARGMILYLAEVLWPTPDKGQSWWARPGLMRWSAHPATYVENLVDGINWEASGGASVSYFYVTVPAAALTAAALLSHVKADISMGVPVVVAVRTSDGTHSLTFWKVKAKRSSGNHFVTVVGYDDTAGTYQVLDTCGLTCNDRGVRAGVSTMSQAAVYALIEAESDNDGILW